jgi:hypothetical protein
VAAVVISSSGAYRNKAVRDSVKRRTMKDFSAQGIMATDDAVYKEVVIIGMYRPQKV